MTNYSFYAIPLGFTMYALLHTYATMILRSATPGKWDSVNPRLAREEAKSKVPPELYKRHQRGMSAAANLMELLPMFYAAIVSALV